MRSAIDYLRIEQQNAARDPRFGFDYKDVADESPQARAFTDAVLRHSVYPETAHNIPGFGLNLRQNLRHMPIDVQHDVAAALPASLRSIAMESIFGALPVGLVNGCALRHDRKGVELDCFVVMLNYGLMLACDLLADALTLEILEGELAEYATSGALYFQHATSVFLSPTAAVINATRVRREWPQDVQAQFAVRSGALTAIMLKFVGLHEIGHIVNGDIEHGDKSIRLSAVADEPAVVDYQIPLSEAGSNWPCEFAADAFATRHLCDWSGRAKSSWPNIAQVYLFFGWLEHVERVRGRTLCSYHPSPADRKNAVKQLAYSLYPDGPAEDYFAYIDDRIATWTSAPRAANS